MSFLSSRDKDCNIFTTLLISPWHKLNTALVASSLRFRFYNEQILCILSNAASKGICLNLNLVHLDCNAGIILDT